MTPLHRASASGQKAVVQWLLDKQKVPPNLVSVSSHIQITPLDIAFRERRWATATILIAYGGSLQTFDSNGFRIALCDASKSDQTGVIKWLAEEHQVHVNLTDHEGNTLLHKACEDNEVGTVEVLVKHGGDPHKRNKIGCTPLHVASLRGHAAVVMWLLKESSVNPNITDNRGNKPLHYASAGGHLETAKVLVEHGADVYARNQKEETALKVAGKASMVEFLQKTEVAQGDLHGRSRRPASLPAEAKLAHTT